MVAVAAAAGRAEADRCAAIIRCYNNCRVVEARDGGGRLRLLLCWLRSAVEVAR